MVLAVIALATLTLTACDSADSADSAEDIRNGFHCLSKWDGNHDGFERLVKRQLNDPGSMETFETRITPVDTSGKHVVFMDFGARNGFGGMVRSTARGTVDNETCEVTLLGIT